MRARASSSHAGSSGSRSLSHGGDSAIKRPRTMVLAMVMELEPDYVVNSRLYMQHMLRRGSPFREVYTEIRRSGVAWRYPIEPYERIDRAPSRSRH